MKSELSAFLKNLGKAVLTVSLFFFFSDTVFSQNLTLGKIQQTVQKGVSKEKILEELGSPNMVTGSSADQETWIYDKVSTTTQTEAKAESGTVIGGAVLGFIGIGGQASKANSGASTTTSQKTLTLVIRFKGDSVDSFATRMSSF
jgi:outer membrane protein assembly factor BamE (lipoprotein component of BamABCDE complex)